MQEAQGYLNLTRTLDDLQAPMHTSGFEMISDVICMHESF